jgi:hypothetical protein
MARQLLKMSKNSRKKICEVRSDYKKLGKVFIIRGLHSKKVDNFLRVFLKKKRKHKSLLKPSRPNSDKSDPAQQVKPGQMELQTIKRGRRLRLIPLAATNK